MIRRTFGNISARLWVKGLTAAVTIAMLSMVALQYNQWRNVERTAIDGQYSLSWNYFQLVLEGQRLSSALDLTQARPTPPDAQTQAQLSLRYQIFASRVLLTHDSRSNVVMAHLPVYQQTHQALDAFMAEADLAWPDNEPPAPFDAARYQALSAAINALLPTLNELMLVSNEQRDKLMGWHLANIQTQAVSTVVLALFLLLLSAVMGLAASHQMRLTEISRAKLDELHRQASHQAHHDSLTGLANRHDFEQQLTQAVARATTGEVISSLLFVDLDHFKRVNDACGHPVGDDLLRQLAHTMQAHLGPQAMLARIGGDEFGVLLPGHNADQAMASGQALCEAIQHFRFPHKGHVFQVQASVGVVALDQHSTTPADAMRDADTACYVAKAAGRGRAQLFVPTDPGVRALRHEMHWASRVEQALAQERLTLTWQRIVPLQVSDSLASQAPFKAEILLRMQDDDGSLISPGLFLPACERFFLAVQVDRWVLEHMLAWLTEHGHLLRPGDRLAVNLSGQSISDETFRQHALGLLRLAGARVNNLMLEVTETAAVNNLEAAKPFFEQVRAMGMLVALDDFGSGMSSFRYLRELPSDVLKIDGQFIRDIEHDEVHALSVRSMCELARATGQRTVAEWVESASIATFLTRLGVDHAQGFHFHRPEPLAQLAPLLASLGDRTTGNG